MQSPFLIHAGLAFLNLVGLGSGYLFMKNWKRWAPAFVIAAGLLITALLNDAIIYLILLAAWLLLLSVDGFLQARKYVFEEGRLAQWPWLPIPIGLLMIGLYFLAATLYLNAAQAAYDRGMASYTTADCVAAGKEFSRVTGVFRLADAGNNRRADEKAQECRFFNAGDEALTAGDYPAAIESFDIYLSSYPNSPLTQQTIDKGAEAYLLWAAELRADDDYEGALEKYTMLAVKYSNASQILDVPAETTAANVEWGDYYHENGEYENAIKQFELVKLGPEDLAVDHDLKNRLAAAYFDWAASQRTASEFEAAIENFQLVVEKYPNTTSATGAAEAIPPSYWEWSQMLIDNDQVQEAIDIYDLLIDNYPDTEAAAMAEAGRAAAYLGLAKSLFEEGKFNDAIDMYHFVQELSADGELLAQIEAGIEETLTGLSLDEGEEGQDVIEDTVKLACDRKPAEFPKVNNLPDERGKFMVCEGVPNGFFISDDLRAHFPAELRYVVKVSVKTVNFNSARYGSRGTLILIRQRVDWEVTVIDVSTGYTVASQTFTGGDPPNHPPSWRFSANPDYIQGDPPSMAEVTAWLVTIY